MSYATIVQFFFLQLEVTAKISFWIELIADNEMEARENLSRIFDGLKVFQDGCAGCVPRVK